MLVLCGAPERQAGAVPGGRGGAGHGGRAGAAAGSPSSAPRTRAGTGLGRTRLVRRGGSVWAVRFPCSQQLEAWLLREVEKPSDLW